MKLLFDSIYLWYLKTFRLHWRSGCLHTQTWGRTQVGEAGTWIQPRFSNLKDSSRGLVGTWFYGLFSICWGYWRRSKKWVKKLNWDCIRWILGKPTFSEWLGCECMMVAFVGCCPFISPIHVLFLLHVDPFLVGFFLFETCAVRLFADLRIRP